MTVKEFMDKCRSMPLTPITPGAPSYAELMETETEIWSNDACRGYAMMAMQDAGLDQQTISKVLHVMHYVFDQVSVAEAEQHYHKG